MYLGLYASPTTTVTTHIIVTTNMLTLTNVELEAQVEAELSENPALEMVEAQRCPRCGAVIDRPPCIHCMQELLAGSLVNVEDGHRPSGEAYASDEDYDPFQGILQPVRLADHILQQLRPLLEPELIPVVTFLAECLDERGLLSATVEQVAQRFQIPPSVVERALLQMQRVDPVGIGSRSPQECLIRQLEMLPPETQNLAQLRPVAHSLLSDHWESFLHGRWDEIPLPPEECSAAVQLIRANLTPYPALADWEGALSRLQGPSSGTVYSRPDVAIYLDAEGELGIEIFSFRPHWLRLSPSFKEMISSANGSSEESWLEMAERARLFIKCLGQRHQTLHRSVEALVDYQERALREGDAYIRPLTRTQLARMLDLHEATVSRAIMGKTAALPDGRIVPLSHFFESGKSIKELIRQMVAQEECPMSDRDIASSLKAAGQPIARRTVAKYRNLLGILPVHLRARQREQVPL